jgi:FKBP-type peptidyl-prolyl cis-trans isomerase
MLSKKLFLCATAAFSIGVGVLMADDDKPSIDDKPQAAAPAGKSPSTQPTLGQKVKTASGLVITLVEEAKNPGALSGDIVWVHYTGKLTSGEQFDSSVGQKPFKFTLGQGQVIKGWDEGVVGMKVGEKRNLVIPPELAYGPGGSGKIPPNATLLFDIEMIGLARPGQP